MKSFLYFSFWSLALVLFNSCNKEEERDHLKVNLDFLEGKVDTTQTIASIILGQNMHFSIYLPPSYDTSHIKYPVLYLLHGMGGNHLDWVKNGISGSMDQLITEKEIKEFIVVMPDGKNAFYCNNYSGGNLLYEDFLVQEFIPQVESRYRINSSRRGRAIGGLSMGAYGATFHAFKRPELFCSAYAMSSAFDMGSSAPDLKRLIEEKLLDSKIILPVFTMECGTEDFLFSTNQAFDQFLSQKGIEHVYVKRSGIHDWAFWHVCLPKALKFVSEQFE